MGYLKEVPSFNMPAKTTGMKGRPITREEFERLQAQTVAVVGAELAADWANDLEGLWWSGLRLGEATILHWWDDRQLAVDLTGRRPMFRIQAASEKGGRFRMLPMAPEFAEWLQRQPEDRRSGFVFQFRSSEGLDRLSTDWVSKLISRMGEKAGVKVSERRKVQGGKLVDEIKYASAHDFRRAFGYRWSTRVMPPVLMEMMRHASITTTMEFYVGRNGEAAADQIWQAFANETANSRATQEQRESRPESKDIA